MYLIIFIDVEEITNKAGSFKKFDVFLKMLISAFNRDSESVHIDLLTSADLELLKLKKLATQQSSSTSTFVSAQSSSSFQKAAPVDESFVSNTSLPSANTTSTKVGSNSKKRYLILTFSNEFDRVHYPLPLAFQDYPTVESLTRTVRRLRRQLTLHDLGNAGNRENRKPVSANRGSAQVFGSGFDEADSRNYAQQIKELRQVVLQLRVENKELHQSIKALGGNNQRSSSRGPTPSRAHATTELIEVLELNMHLRKQLERYELDLKELSSAFETIRIDAAKEISGLKAKLRVALGLTEDASQIPNGNNTSTSATRKAIAASLVNAEQGGSSMIDSLRRRVLSLERELRLEQSLNSSAISRQTSVRSHSQYRTAAETSTRSRSVDSGSRSVGFNTQSRSRYPTPHRRYERKSTPGRGEPASYDNVKSSGYGYNQIKSRPGSRHSSRGSTRSPSPSSVGSSRGVAASNMASGIDSTNRRPSPSQYIQSLSSRPTSSQYSDKNASSSTVGIAAYRSRPASPQISRLEELTESLLYRVRATGGSRDRGTTGGGGTATTNRPPWGAGSGLTGSRGSSRERERERESGYSSAHSQSSRASRGSSRDAEHDRRIAIRRNSNSNRGTRQHGANHETGVSILSDMESAAFSKTEKWTRRLQERQRKLEVEEKQQAKPSIVQTQQTNASTAVHVQNIEDRQSAPSQVGSETVTAIESNNQSCISQPVDTTETQIKTSTISPTSRKSRISQTKDVLLSLIEEASTPDQQSPAAEALNTPSPSQAVREFHAAFLRQSKELLVPEVKPASEASQVKSPPPIVSRSLPSLPNESTVLRPTVSASVELPRQVLQSQSSHDVPQPTVSASIELPRKPVPKSQAPLLQNVQSPIKSPSASQQLSGNVLKMRSSASAHVTSPTQSLSENIRSVKARIRTSANSVTRESASDLQKSVSESTDRLVPSLNRSYSESPSRAVSTAPVEGPKNSSSPGKALERVRNSLLRNSGEFSDERLRQSLQQSASKSMSLNDSNHIVNDDDNDELSQIDKRILALQSYLDKARQGLRKD